MGRGQREKHPAPSISRKAAAARIARVVVVAARLIEIAADIQWQISCVSAAAESSAVTSLSVMSLLSYR